MLPDYDKLNTTEYFRISLMKRRLFLVLIIVGLFNLLKYQDISPAKAQGGNLITLDSSITYQIMTGWEVTAYAWGQPGHSQSFPLFMDDLSEQAINDLGINRIRLEITGGAENSTDYATQYFNWDGDWNNPSCINPTEPCITEMEYVHNPGYGSQIINDNSDPNVINWNGFHFSFLDHKIDNIILPLKQRIEANGEKLYVNLNFVNFETKSGSDMTFYDHPNEYAEFMLATFEHMNTKYGFVPDAIEVILEPNLASGWGSGDRVANALVAAAQRLEINGYTPDFIAPSDSVMVHARDRFDRMVNNVPLILNYLTELSYHCYWGACNTNDGLLQDMANRGIQYNIGTSMLEWWTSSNSYHTLHKGLKIGRNSAWQDWTLGGTYVIDETDPLNPIITLSNRAKFTRQYYKFVRSGAQRIEATSNNANLDPLAFINTNGNYVVVVNASSGGNFSIQGLSAGTYGIMYTVGTANGRWGVERPNIKLSDGEDLTTDILSAGVITIYAQSVSPTLSPTPTPTCTGTGDVNCDSQVNAEDIILVLTNWLSSSLTQPRADVNEDGKVNGMDFGYVIIDWGKS